MDDLRAAAETICSDWEMDRSAAARGAWSVTGHRTCCGDAQSCSASNRYARVSTSEQSLDLQQDALTRAGCDRMFTNVASGAQAERPQPKVTPGKDPLSRGGVASHRWEEPIPSRVLTSV